LFPRLSSKDLLSIAQLSRGEIEMLFATAAAFKRRPAAFCRALEGRTITMLFEKESLRTLVTFEIGVARLGGMAVYLDHRLSRIGEREDIRDYAKNLERWTDAIIARTYEHSTLETLAREARVPVINALSNLSHPCQGLADYFTLAERFATLTGLRLAYVGDGNNNVCHSLLLGAAKLGLSMTVICPRGYEPAASVQALARAAAAESGACIAITADTGAVASHHAVYTDTWVSMGQECDAERRRRDFPPYQVTAELMNAAGLGAVFMHCLPAHRGEEVAAEVIDSPRSIVFDQAENRLHVQNAILLHTIGGLAGEPRGMPRGSRGTRGERSRRRAAPPVSVPVPAPVSPVAVASPSRAAAH
jgi:ornithine carbamoyltransferase